MRLRFSVGLRTYGESLVIAQTLGLPRVSAAGDNQSDALERLGDELRQALSYSHPRMLMEIMTPETSKTLRALLPVHDGDRDQLETIRPVMVDVVVERYRGTLARVLVPLYHLGMWTQVDALSGEVDLEAVLAQFARGIVPIRQEWLVDRPMPESFELLDFEVEFEPLDLARTPGDMRWKEYFEPDELAKNQEEQRASTPTLEAVAQCWASKLSGEGQEKGVASFFEPFFGRSESLGELANLMEGAGVSAVVVVGPSRVGKTALIKAYARRAQELIDAGQSRREVFFADPPRLCAADPFSAGWQQQCRDICRELEESGHVLYLGRLIEALDAGKYVGSEYHLAQFLKPWLADKRLRLVAEATVEEWNRVQERDIGFASTFTVIRLEEVAEPIGLEIVGKSAAHWSEKLSIPLAPQAVERAWALQRRFATEGSVLGRTIDFVVRTLRRAQQVRRERIEVSDVVDSFCKDTGMPAVLLRDDRTLDLDVVQRQLARRVIGQKSALDKVVDVVGVTKAGMSASDRPLGSFLFVGPTGVGKTELARALAQFLFSNESRLIRLDMSEYAQLDAYNRLIGEGGNDGDLTGPVRRQPFCVVLLDEIEKAHPNVFDLLLQVLGEARLTDVQGRTTRFQNTILIMTSNLGVETLKPAMGFSDAARDGTQGYGVHFRREAEKFFRPEFLARVDQFIAFDPLSRETIRAIATRELDEICKREGMLSRDVQLVVSDEVVSYLAEEAHDIRYGARPLKRLIERLVVEPLASSLAQWSVDNPDQSHGLVAELSMAPEARGELLWKLAAAGRDGVGLGVSRQVLLDQLDEVMRLRRRLYRTTYADAFSNLEWQVSEYDISSQSADFWKASEAASLARDAEDARRIVVPAQRLEQELSALEDLATEAYHGRAFDIVSDIDERLAELEQRIDDLFMIVLRTTYERPDEMTFFIVPRGSQDGWRNQLLVWYRQLVRLQDWRLELWQPDPGRDDEEDDSPQGGWKRVNELGPGIVGLTISGRGARVILSGESGLHRIMAPEGNAVVEIVGLEEGESWPEASSLELGVVGARVVRTWNFRTREVTLGEDVSLPFDPRVPWESIWDELEELAWQRIEPVW